MASGCHVSSCGSSGDHCNKQYEYPEALANIDTIARSAARTIDIPITCRLILVASADKHRNNTMYSLFYVKFRKDAHRESIKWFSEKEIN
jgi:hypothetical protein